MKIYGKNAIKEKLINEPKSISKIYISNTFKDDFIFDLIKKNKIKYIKTSNND